MNESGEQCFICMESEELYSHCTCNLKVHKECFTRYMKTRLDQQIECSVCKQAYRLNVKKYVNTLSFNLIMLLTFLLVVNQIIVTVCFGILYESGIIFNSILSYILLTFYVALSFLYQRQTNRWKWWAFGRVIIESEICTVNNFSIPVKEEEDIQRCGCVSIKNTDLYIKSSTICEIET